MLSYLVFATFSFRFLLPEIREVVALTDAQLNHLAGLSNTSHLNEILDNICVPRVVGTAAHDNVKKYIVSKLTDMRWDVQLDSFKEKTPIFGVLEFNNIIATKNPVAKKYLILACHYESKYFKDFDFVGATDAAVSCSMIMNLAYVMKDEIDSQGDVELKLIFFDGEEAFKHWSDEDSLYGSRHLAAKYEEEKEIEKIDLFLLLDLLGAKNPAIYSYFHNTNSLYLKLIEAERRLSELGHLNTTCTYFQDAHRPDVCDDHIPFLKRGVPILHLIVTPFPPIWHTVNDDRQAVDMTVTENLNKILRVFVAEYLNLSVKS